MTERDFEAFLTLLKRLLRTGKRQRDAIVGELRDHLLQRLDALTAQGLSRDEAMTRALEEFGDAAVLAAHFTAISRNRNRRILMRTTLGTLVSAVVVIACAVAFWPQGGSAPLAPNSVVAQDPPAAAENNAPAAAAEPDEDALNDQTTNKLKKRIDAEFQELPIEDALKSIAASTQVQFYTDRRALEDVGINADTPVSITLNSVPCDMLLDLILGQLDLAYTMRSGIVIVTTPEEAEAQMIVRVYAVSDLAARAAAPLDKNQQALGALSRLAEGGAQGGFGGGSGVVRVPLLESLLQLWARRVALKQEGKAEEAAQVEAEFYQMTSEIFARQSFSDADELIELIVQTVSPDTWNDVGGLGSIMSYRDKLVVTQTAAVHRQVDDLLRQLRQKGDAAAAPGQDEAEAR
jgi:hypothetical protein